MPIQTDTTRVSVDFGWEYTFPNGETIRYNMKFYHSEAGEIVQISNGPYEPVEVPAAMFTEVAEFLISQGVVKGAPLARTTQKAAGAGLGTSLLGRKPTTIVKADPVQTLVEGEEKVETAEPNKKSEEEERLMAERLEAKARAKAEGTKNKFRSSPKPDPNPPKPRPGARS